MANTGATKLATRQLGKNGPNVTRIGYGTMGLSAFYGAAKPDEERFKLLDKLYADGELFWDTADMYGDSEDLLGTSCHHLSTTDPLTSFFQAAGSSRTPASVRTSS